MTKQILTHSRISCAKQCPKKHFFQYELGIVPARDSKPLGIGSAIHKGIEKNADGKSTEISIQAALTTYGSCPDYRTDFDHQIDRMIIIRLLHAYFWYYEGWKFKIKANEKEFRYSIVNPETGRPSPKFDQSGKIDKIIEDVEGVEAIMDHKTTGSSIDPNCDFWNKLRLDHQITMYFCGARALGFDPQYMLYDVIHKPGIKPKNVPCRDDLGLKIVTDQTGERVFKKDTTPRQTTDKAKGFEVQYRMETPAEYGDRLSEDIMQRPEFYFQRHKVYRLEKDIELFQHEIWQFQQQIGEAQKSNRWFRNTNACLVPFRCQYADICFNNVEPTKDKIPDGFVKTENIHPELNEI